VSYTEKDLVSAVRTLLLTGAPANWPIVTGSIRQLSTAANPAGPDATTAITPFPVVEDDDTGTTVAGLNIHMRGGRSSGSNAVLDEAERVRSALVQLRMTTLGGVPVTSCWRDRATPLALDPEGRFERIDTYYVQTDRLGLTA
jgi:hypothetical protein